MNVFRDFLRFRTISAEGPVTGSYRVAVEYLKQLFESAGVPTEVKEYIPGKPVLVATIVGAFLECEIQCE